jgi:hypothetical protein
MSRTTARVPGWQLDPQDPRAPSDEVWAELTDEQRALVVAALPCSISRLDPVFDLQPPEGDEHDDAGHGARDALRRWYGKLGRRAYVGTDLAVYYPGARMIAPDLIVVLDVEPAKRSSWIVQAEGKGLDLALEAHAIGSWRKDFVENVERYAALGIPEYFAFDMNKGVLLGWQLDRETKRYQRITPGPDGLRSTVLGLDLCVEGKRVRFSHAGARIPEVDELLGRLESAMSDTLARVTALEGELEAERAAREAERAAREEAERRIAALEAEIAKRSEGRK